MCGIFGVVRNQFAVNPEKVTAVIAELGAHSVSRGRDSSGLAFIHDSCERSTIESTPSQARMSNVTLGGGVTIVKDTKPFNDMWNDYRDASLAAQSSAIIGHTRAATQGARSDLANASPMVVGTLVGTHNGDVDVKSLKATLTKPVGGTDTESLYLAIHSSNSHRGRIRKTLEEVEGRVALAWYDRKIPNRINLVRGGLSPMAIAIDAEGNMYWASSPQWFRDIDEKFNGAIGFQDIWMVPEGKMVTVMFNTGEPVIEDVRDFTPTVRYSDSVLGESIIWRGFSEEDIATDRNGATSTVLPPPAPAVSKRYGAPRYNDSWSNPSARSGVYDYSHGYESDLESLATGYSEFDDFDSEQYVDIESMTNDEWIEYLKSEEMGEGFDIEGMTPDESMASTPPEDEIADLEFFTEMIGENGTADNYAEMKDAVSSAMSASGIAYTLSIVSNVWEGASTPEEVSDLTREAQSLLDWINDWETLVRAKSDYQLPSLNSARLFILELHEIAAKHTDGSAAKDWNSKNRVAVDS